MMSPVSKKNKAKPKKEITDPLLIWPSPASFFRKHLPLSTAAGEEAERRYSTYKSCALRTNCWTSRRTLFGNLEEVNLLLAWSLRMHWHSFLFGSLPLFILKGKYVNIKEKLVKFELDPVLELNSNVGKYWFLDQTLCKVIVMNFLIVWNVWLYVWLWVCL